MYTLNETRLYISGRKAGLTMTLKTRYDSPLDAWDAEARARENMTGKELADVFGTQDEYRVVRVIVSMPKNGVAA